MVLGEHHESEVRLAAVFKGDRPMRDVCAGTHHLESNTIAGHGGHGPHSTRDESLKRGSSPFYFYLLHLCHNRHREDNNKTAASFDTAEYMTHLITKFNYRRKSLTPSTCVAPDLCNRPVDE